MRGEPTTNLLKLLERLRLATAEQVLSMSPRVMRLAGDLPDIESVWVDALAQARILTPLQAAEINAGRGDALVHGPYVICNRLRGPHYAACYAARHVDTARRVRLYLIQRPQVEPIDATRALPRLVDNLHPIAGSSTGAPIDSGISGPAVWAACDEFEGIAAYDWMIENGRFLPQVVCYVARQMLERLAQLQQFGIVHGDVSTAGLWLSPAGAVTLPMPGLRGIVRPHEGYGCDDLACEAYDYLPPERVALGSPPTHAGDLYACACVWWHLLTGRAPLGGGNSLAKLRAVHAARISDVRRLAPSVPQSLARAMEMCLARDPADRPPLAQLQSILSSSARSSAHDLARCIARPEGVWLGRSHTSTPRQRSTKRVLATVSVAAVCCMILAGWVVQRRGGAEKPAESLADRTPRPLPVAAQPIDRLSDANPVASTDEQSPAAEIQLVNATSPATAANANEIVVKAGSEIRAAELELRDGLHLRAAPGKRPRIIIPSSGFVLEHDGVRFVGLDFVQESPGNTQVSGRPRAMIRLEAQAIRFDDCSFDSTEETPPCAIDWTGARDTARTAEGEIGLRDCTFRGLAAVVECQADCALNLSLHNVLCVAAGPIVSLLGSPRSEAPIALLLDRVTARGDTAIVQCRYGRVEKTPGTIAITANDCVFDANPRGGLLVFRGQQRPTGLLGSIRWGGEGSLVTPRTAIAIWRSSSGPPEVLKEDDLEIDGLVRSQVEFAADPAGAAVASEAVRWQVPLRGDDPPGVRAGSLSLAPR